MSATARSARLLSFIVLAAVQLGCGPAIDSEGNTAIDGTATWNGKPIADGHVELAPLTGGGGIDGADIVNGRFTVRTKEGEKLVTVTARRKIGETPATERMPAEVVYHQYIPEKFNKNTDLKVTVSAGEPLQLNLEGKELAPGTESAADRERRMAQRGVQIEGTATWNGEPIADGHVELTPVTGERVTDAADIVDGKFNILTSEGEKLVKVTATTEEYHQYIPEEWNTKSELKVTISAANPTLKLDLKGTEPKPGE